jgi:hypothetical protein
MQKALGLVETPHSRFGTDRREPSYRAITQGGERDQWAVVDGQGAVVYRGDARVAAMIASRLTRPAR